MNHQTPLITRRAKTVQTTPKVTAKPLWVEFSEAALGEVEEGREDVEEVDDVDDDDDDDDDDREEGCMSFASRTVYLEEVKKKQFAKSWKMLRKKCIHQGIHDSKRLTRSY